MARITINGVSLDPVAQSEGLRAASLESRDASGSNYVLIQTKAPLSEEHQRGGRSTSAALIKALPVNGAVELVGQYNPSEAGPSPNNNAGFGRVNLAGSVIIPGPNVDGGFGEAGPLKQGDEDTITIRVPEEVPGSKGRMPRAAGAAPTGASPSLKLTLVWSDPPGAALQNDLDLIIRAPNGQERHGNMGTSKGFDRANNVEQVVWDNIPPGDVNVTVQAFRITKFPQSYAYAWRVS